MFSGTDLTLEILRQPNDGTCGPACLHAVYGFHGDPVPLETAIAQVLRPPEPRGADAA